MIPVAESFLFSATPVINGFSYDSLTGEFTVHGSGVYYFSVSVLADDGGVHATPLEYYFQLEGVPRPSDSLISCVVANPGVTQQCTTSFIMSLSEGTVFSLRNETEADAYVGTYEGNPFTNTFQLTVVQLDD